MLGSHSYMLCSLSGHGCAPLQRQPATFQPLLATVGHGVFGQGVRLGWKQGDSCAS